MGTEDERKRLVADASFLGDREGVLIRQGYLTHGSPARSVRVRTEGKSAKITVKGPTKDNKRPEWEFDIPPETANEILQFAAIKPLIEKTRYKVDHSGCTWEVDVFHGTNQGLIVAEAERGIETAPSDWPPKKPSWAGQDVSKVSRYINNNLIEYPYRDWPEEFRTRSDGTAAEAVEDME